MGVFSYIYFHSFIGIGGVSVKNVFDAFSQLNTQDQLELYQKLKEYFDSKY
jgi:hypothetical protein